VANLATFLFGAVGSRDIHVVAAALMLAVMVACALPARRAAKIDAIDALRR
jgi:ABC-type lipoprotein release transport system permease subunit